MKCTTLILMIPLVAAVTSRLLFADGGAGGTGNCNVGCHLGQDWKIGNDCIHAVRQTCCTWAYATNPNGTYALTGESDVLHYAYTDDICIPDCAYANDSTASPYVLGSNQSVHGNYPHCRCD